MSTSPLLTIVTPCLNAAATLPEALESVRREGLGDVVEHIVIDGASTDGTLEVLAAAKGVRWTSEPDGGLSDAMNKGLLQARGEFIGWLNADDFYLPGALSRVLGHINLDPALTWLTAPCLIVDEHGSEIRMAVTRYKRLFLRHHSHRLLLLQNYIAAPSTFFRRDVAQEVGGFDERFRYSMDYDLWLKLSALARPVILKEPVTAFRMAGDSLSMTGFERQFAEHAQNAREHGADHPLAVGLNRVLSRLIVLAYRLMRRTRTEP